MDKIYIRAQFLFDESILTPRSPSIHPATQRTKEQKITYRIPKHTFIPSSHDSIIYIEQLYVIKK